MNRPHPQTTYERLVEGLIDFRRVYEGKLWVEVMLVAGANDDERALDDLAAALEGVRADAVHINLPTRPPAEPWVRPPDEEGLMRASAILGKSAEVVHPAQGTFAIQQQADPAESIIEVVTRHPMRTEELRAALIRMLPPQSASVREAPLQRILEQLEASGRAQRIQRYGTTFYTAAGSRFPVTPPGRQEIRNIKSGREV